MNGAEYLKYSERQTKTRTGAEPRMSEQLNLKLSVSQAVRRTEIQCLFTKFILRKGLARSLKDSDSMFYLGINYTKNPTEKP